MITFSDIYEAMRKEKYGEELQMLPINFLKEVAEYLREKKEFLSKEDDSFSEMSLKNKKKLENAMASFRELISTRKKKILSLAFVSAEVGISKKDFENLLGYEKDLFEKIVRGLDEAEATLNNEMSGAPVEVVKQKLVRFLEDVPEFLGFEGENTGPFKKGDIANLEREIVEILAKDKRIEVLEEE